MPRHSPSQTPRPHAAWVGVLTGNVLILGLVSFFTDASSEMIYPLLPTFLTTVLGAGPAFLGVIEGVAESTAAIFKLFSGMWADRMRDRTRLVLAGYSLSSLSRPLVALAQHPWVVLVIRFADRVGKGIRTSPRDAIIADSVDASRRGMAYGFHRSMDHAGAVVGPLIATALLATWVKDLRTLFWLASIPGALAVLLILFRVRDVPRTAPSGPANGRFLHTIPRGVLRRYLLILLLFTLGNSSDAFLLLRAGQLGVPIMALPLIWVVFHIVKMTSSLPLGAFSDRVGRRGVILAGWTMYGLTYVGFALATTAAHAWMLFALYGLFYGLTEGAERALLADLAPPAERGSAFGWFHGVVGIGALPASLLFGVLWQRVNAPAAFFCGAALAAMAAVLFAFFVPRRTPAAAA